MFRDDARVVGSYVILSAVVAITFVVALGGSATDYAGVRRLCRRIENEVHDEAAA